MRVIIKFERSEERDLPDTATVGDLLSTIEDITGFTRGDYRIVHNGRIIQQQTGLLLKDDLHFGDTEELHVFAQIRPSRQSTPAAESNETPQRQAIPFPGVPGINGGVITFEINEDGRPTVREGQEGITGIFGSIMQHVLPGIQQMIGQQRQQQPQAPDTQQQQPNQQTQQQPQPARQQRTVSNSTGRAQQPARQQQNAGQEIRQRAATGARASTRGRNDPISEMFNTVSNYEEEALKCEVQDARGRVLRAYETNINKLRDFEHNLLERASNGENVTQKLLVNMNAQEKLIKIFKKQLETRDVLQEIQDDAGVQIRDLDLAQMRRLLGELEQLVL